MHMSNTRPNIPLNDDVLCTLRAGVEVSCEPPGVHTRQRPIACPTESLHPVEDTIPQTGVSSMGRPRIMATSCIVIMISPDERWNVWVSGCHQSMSAVIVVASISGRPRLMSRASGRNPA
jgi:hypothetical protein